MCGVSTARTKKSKRCEVAREIGFQKVSDADSVSDVVDTRKSGPLLLNRRAVDE